MRPLAALVFLAALACGGPAAGPTLHRGIGPASVRPADGRIADHAAGFRVAIHANGNVAIDDALRALAAAHPGEDARRVVNAQVTQPDPLARRQRLGPIPSFFALHTGSWGGDRERERFLGSERAARISPARSARQAGGRFTLPCDAAAVPIEPLRLVWAAVNRRTTSRQALGPAERIDVATALRAVTGDTAYPHFEEDLEDSLEPGELADRPVLARSPLGEPPQTLAALPVLDTIVGGETVWRAP